MLSRRTLVSGAGAACLLPFGARAEPAQKPGERFVACGELHPEEHEIDAILDVLAEEYNQEEPLSGDEAAALRIDKDWGRWDPRRLKYNEDIPLKVGFTSYHPIMNKVVEDAAKEWSSHMDLGISFDENDVDILVEHDAVGNSSRLGVASRYFAQRGVPSLKLQDFSDSSDDLKFGVTLHELGHALGLVHEHQHPESGIKFNEEEVYDYFKDKYDWKRSTTKKSVLDQYGTSGRYAVGARTEFDSHSIMMYELPAGLLENPDDALFMNLSLSELDKQLIDNIY